jgi:hypothetical protein
MNSSRAKFWDPMFKAMRVIKVPMKTATIDVYGSQESSKFEPRAKNMFLGSQMVTMSMAMAVVATADAAQFM